MSGSTAIRAALLAVVAVALAGCGAATTRVSAGPPQRPHLPAKRSAHLVCHRNVGNDMAIGVCEILDRVRLNARFNATVAALWPKLDATGKREFARGQQSWRAFMAAECDVASREYLGGTASPVVAGACFVSMTRSRVNEVAGLLKLYGQGR